jgi:hypothetical protein
MLALFSVYLVAMSTVVPQPAPVRGSRATPVRARLRCCGYGRATVFPPSDADEQAESGHESPYRHITRLGVPAERRSRIQVHLIGIGSVHRARRVVQRSNF